MKYLATSLAVSAALALSACGSPAADDAANDETAAGETAETGNTVLDVAGQNPDFSTLVELVGTAGLGDTLSSEGPFTVFAPTNAAFDKLDSDARTALTSEEGRNELIGVLTYHVVQGSMSAQELSAAIDEAEGGELELGTVQGGKIMAKKDGENIVLTDAAGNTATVGTVDVDGSNGLIHSIDTVLMPS
jgi:uncharacterized surface protein with fasciclin (FAS1) repeats